MHEHNDQSDGNPQEEAETGLNLPDDVSIAVSEDRLHLLLEDREITLKVHVEGGDALQPVSDLDPMRNEYEPEVRRSDDLVHWDVETDEYHLSILPEVFEADER